MTTINHLPVPQFEQGAKARLRDFYDRNARRREGYRKRNWYYHQTLTDYLKSVIPQGSSVLEIGCGDGRLLGELKPSRGLGIDFSADMVREAKKRETDRCEFVEADIEYATFTETFDYIVLFDCIGILLDIQRAFENIKTACGERTRIVIHYHSMLWEPFLKVLEALHLKMPQPHHNWLSDSDVRNFMTLSGLDLVRYDRCLLAPAWLPVLSNFCNRFLAPLPIVNNCCVSHLFVMRALAAPTATRSFSATICIPCRNERGTIREAVSRIPPFGSHQEIMFVDGRSTDGTPDEIRTLMRERPDLDIKLLTQPGNGKGDAVRHGFSKASGELLMILDADLTVPPEYLARCYDAIVENRGELLIGSRLVYPMEKQAMRFLNILGNRIFSSLFSWLLNQKIKDTLCGTKVILRANYEKVRSTFPFFGDFDPFGDFELIFGASKQNLKILEVPFRYRERTYGATNIDRFAHGWLLLKMVFFALRKIKMR
jgi:SAM-dependent methyltransferase